MTLGGEDIQYLTEYEDSPETRKEQTSPKKTSPKRKREETQKTTEKSKPKLPSDSSVASENSFGTISRAIEVKNEEENWKEKYLSMKKDYQLLHNNYKSLCNKFKSLRKSHRRVEQEEWFLFLSRL